MSEHIDDNDALDKNMKKSSDEAVEDIEQLLLSLLETGADYEKNVKILLENPEVLEDDVPRLKYAIEAYENLKKIDSQLVDTHTKWVAIKKIVGEDVDEHEKFAPEISEELMKDFREEQKEYKTKIEDKRATSSDHEMVGIWKVCDLDLK